MSTDLHQGVRYDARHAAAYDRKIRQLIPGYDTLHELSEFLLATLLPADARILVAGSGSGEELLRYARRGTGWSLAGVEPSADMNLLAAAKLKDADLAGRVTLLQGKLGEVMLGEGYDAVTSLLVMHFLPDDGAKAAYLKALAAALRPGGWLLLADLGGERGEAGFERLFAVWRAQQDATRDKSELVALDFAHLGVNVHPLAEARRETLLVDAGLLLVQEYWRGLGLSAVLIRKPV